MKSHWPLLIALLFVLGASGLGLYQRESLQEDLSQPARVKPLPVVKAAPPAPAGNPVITPVVVPKENVDVTVRAERTPAHPAIPPTANVDAPRPAMVNQNKPMVAPNQNLKAVVDALKQQVVTAPDPQATQALTELRMRMTNEFGVQPVINANGYEFILPGALVRVSQRPDWLYTITNTNNADVKVESDNFKAGLNDALAALGIDVKRMPEAQENGKSHLTTNCKLGRISITRDSTDGQRIQIRPLHVTPKPATLEAIAPPVNVQVVPDKPVQNAITPTPPAPEKKPVEAPKQPQGEQF